MYSHCGTLLRPAGVYSHIVIKRIHFNNYCRSVQSFCGTLLRPAVCYLAFLSLCLILIPFSTSLIIYFWFLKIGWQRKKILVDTLSTKAILNSNNKATSKLGINFWIYIKFNLVKPWLLPMCWKWQVVHTFIMSYYDLQVYE